jgi:hypothetical protein
MSILIKGLHKPDENHGCPFVDVEYGYCLVDLGVTGNGEKCERMKDRCPLIELPDHGDLIDRDKFVAEKREQFCADCSKRKSPKTGRFVYEIGDCVCRACDIDDMLDYIEDAPVIIPAERSEK